MRFFIYILCFITNCANAVAQVNFKTLVPENPIIVGEAFPVQYVLETILPDDNCKPPGFKNFKLVSGPSVYKSNNGHLLKNTVYTLEALRPGKFVIEGASVDYKGSTFKSNSVVVQVITKAEAFHRGILTGEAPSNNDLFLQPGEDPQKKISNNLFVKLVTDKQSCYVGDPVTATFKLYSRLQSTSDIVKNPGFYGFTVYDVLGIKDNKTVKETVNGKQYDVHIIRKVQLYPLKAGALAIDEMEIENTVVFTDSPALRKVEQQIIEGVIAEKSNSKAKPGTHEYTSSIRTVPVTIQVKELPITKRPSDYTGATGLFTIKTGVSKKELGVNEEAELVVKVSGKGNFTQLTAPVIEWPVGIEGFEPSVIDSLDNTSSPVKGSRTFHYSFVVSKAGKYSLPALRFSFFNPDTNAYKLISTKTISLQVKEGTTVKTRKMGITTETFNAYLPALAGVAILLLSLLFFFFWRNKRRQKFFIEQKSNAGTTKKLTVKEILQSSLAATSADDAFFYSSLRQGIWNYLSDRLGVSTAMSNERLTAALTARADQSSVIEILQILSETETHTYGGVTSSGDKVAMYHRTLNVLEKIDAGIQK